LYYHLLKRGENKRLSLGIKPINLVTTFNRRLKKGFSVFKITRDITKILDIFLYQKKIKGYYIRVKGRFKRGRRKSKLVNRKGFIAFNTLDLRLESCYGLLYSRFGIAGLKIILSH